MARVLLHRLGYGGVAALLLFRRCFAVQPNPPVWPDSVQVFRPSDDPARIEMAVRAAFEQNGGHEQSEHGQFSTSRFAFLFEPGSYRVDVPVGFYTQVLGLGTSPEDVAFDSARGVFSEEGDQSDIGGALSTFWRGAENFRTTSDMLWAVSQAAPLRRLIADKNLALAQYLQGIGMGYSSGGFVGNVRVGAQLQFGSQQQFCTRNADLAGGTQGGVWNMVYIGSPGAPNGHCGRSDGLPGTVTVAAAPVIAEKPFISINSLGQYTLQVPEVRFERTGTDFSTGRAVDFSSVFVARSTDAASLINEHLAAGEHVVLSPGIYELDEPLYVQYDNQVLLGLGFATLVSDQGNCLIYVGNVDGARVAGVLLQAGPTEAQVLLQWGDGTHRGDASNPGFLHDVFARVGGDNDPLQSQVSAQLMVRIASGHVVGDNLWLWRADHGVAGLVRGGMNPCKTGLVVTGDNVIMYGLAVEHTLGDLVQWSGDRGKTFFFQSELPYDVTQAYGDAGYVGYRINDSVAEHQAFGVGVYQFFRDFDVVVPRGIAAPPWLANSFEAPLSVYLTGRGEISRVLNDRGNPTRNGVQVDWSCDKGPEVAVTPVSVVSVDGATRSRSEVEFLASLSSQQKRDRFDSTQMQFASPPWWVLALAAQAALLLLVVAYAVRLRSQVDGLPVAHGSVPSSPNLAVRQGLRQCMLLSPMRLRGLPGFSRAFSGAPSAAGTPASTPASRTDAARTLRFSPTASEVSCNSGGARKTRWPSVLE